MKQNNYLANGFKIIVAVALLAAISSGCGSSAEKVIASRVGPRAISETVMVAGSLQGTSPTQVIPQVSGSIAQVYADDGQEVAAGQPIVQLNTSDLEQALLTAQASLEASQSLAAVVNNLSSTASNVSDSFSSLMTSVDTGLISLFNLEKLLIPLLPEAQRLAALQGVENAYNSYQQAVAARSGPAGITSSGYDTGAQEAAAGKAIENAENDLSAATVTAPVAGVLVAAQTGGTSIEGLLGSMMSSFSGMMPSGMNLSSLTSATSGLGGLGMPSGGPLSKGSFVSAGSPIFTIVDLKSMSVVAKVDESDISKMSVGQAAQVTLEAYPGKEFAGAVVKVANSATTNEAGATAFEVTIQLNTSDTNLKIGMTGTADVTVATRDAAAVVPVDAIVDKKGKKYVFRVVKGKAKLTSVSTGLATESDVEITEGVEIGDKVVTKGVEKLKDGQGVKI